MTHQATQAKKLGSGIAVPVGVLLLGLGGCVIYLMFDRRTRKRAAQNFRKGGNQSQVLLARVDIDCVTVTVLHAPPVLSVEKQ